MRLFHSRVRNRKRSSFLNTAISAVLSIPLVLLLVFISLGVEGGITSFSVSASKTSLLSSSTINFFGTFIVLYLAFPDFALTKSIRNGKEKEVQFSAQQSSPQPFPPSGAYSSRSLQVPENATSASEELDSDSSELDSEMRIVKEFQGSKRKRRRNRLSRQMGLAQEIAIVAPALQTMGCIPKFFCGMNSKAPNEETSALNDLAYLIKFAMMDDDDVGYEESLFDSSNKKGKDGLQGNKKRRKPMEQVKDDLILENMAEEELIQEDPANLPFVWTDMENRIKTKGKPGNKERYDEELMDAIIVEPEQSSVGALLTGIKSVLRIGRSVDHTLQGNASQVSPRGLSNRSTKSLMRRRQGWRRRWKTPFWRTPQFRQDMELAKRIGKTEKDDAKCSSTFNVCPYTVHEMMDIVHGGYQRREKKKNKQKQQWFLNANGPPESSEEDTSAKPFKDPENLITTTTEKTHFHQKDPESQIYYSLYPHKAIEKGMTTVPTTTRRPSAGSHDQRRPPGKIQSHVEYENDESSKEPRPEHMDLQLNKNKNKNRRPQFNPWRPPNQPGPHGKRPLIRPQPTVYVEQISYEDNNSQDEQDDKGKQSEDSNEDGNSSEEKAKSQQLENRPMPPPQPMSGTQQAFGNPKPPFHPIQPFLQNGPPQSKPNPIARPRPKYKLQKQTKLQKARRPRPPTPPTEDQQKDEERGEDEDEEEGEEEDEADGEEDSQENSSEENKDKKTLPPPPDGPSTPNNHNNNNPPKVVHGRPSEEVGQQPKERNNPPSTEDDLDNSDEEQNSNSGPVEGSREQDLISMELAKIPKPARPPRPKFGMKNHSSEYSDEMGGRPHLRPINYSYFKRPQDQNEGPPHPQGPPASPSPPPNSSTQKYSTGFLSFIFGKKDDKSKQKPGNFKNRLPQPPPPTNSDEEDGNEADDDDDDGSDESEETKKQDRPNGLTGPDGKYEVGYLGPRPSPITPNFEPPVKPERPYKGATSMEDSDEKRVRSHVHRTSTTPAPTENSSNKPIVQIPQLEGLGQILFIGKPHRINDIPPPATPPPRTSTTPDIQPSTTPATPSKKSKDSDEDEAESDEDKLSEETSKESKESSEENERQKPASKPGSTKPEGISAEKKQNDERIPPPPPIANFRPQVPPAKPSAPQAKIPSSTAKPLKTRTDYSEEKQLDDSNQTKEDDDSGEDNKETNSDENSDEGSSEEDKKPKRPPPRRKPEDDELDNRPEHLPPQRPLLGDVVQIGEILNVPATVDDDEADGQEDGDIPAPPPLAQGFATSLEIVVPTKAPPPKFSIKKIVSQGGVPNQATGEDGNSPSSGTRNPSEQFQGVRNPGGSSNSNRGPSLDNGMKNQKQQQKQQQQKPKDEDEDGKKSSEEKSSEEKKEKSSEESEEEDMLKGVIAGFDSVVVGSADDHDEQNDGGRPNKNPPPPPPLFTGPTAQKQQLLNGKPYPPRPISKPQLPQFNRPNSLRNELLQQQQHKPSPMRPMQPNGQGPQQQRPSFSMSSLLRPLIGRPIYKKKPLDPKVVQWIRESYGIPDLNNNQSPPHHLQQPNRSGLESLDAKENSTMPAKVEKNRKKVSDKSSEKPSAKNKSVEKTSHNKNNKSTEKIKLGKLKPGNDYEDVEAKMAQALFSSSEENHEEEETSEEDSKVGKPQQIKVSIVNKSVERKSSSELNSKVKISPPADESTKKPTPSSKENVKPTSSERPHISSLERSSSSEVRKKLHTSSREKLKPSSAESKPKLPLKKIVSSVEVKGISNLSNEWKHPPPSTTSKPPTGSGRKGTMAPEKTKSKTKSSSRLRPMKAPPASTKIIVSIKSKSGRNRNGTKSHPTSTKASLRLPPIYGKQRQRFG